MEGGVPDRQDFDYTFDNYAKLVGRLVELRTNAGEQLSEHAAPFDALVAGKREAGLARYIMDVKCPGSGMKAVKAFENLRILRREDEVKFVLADRTDYEFARDVVATHEIPAATLLFSPVTPAHKVGKGLDPATLAAWILEDRLDVRLQPQVHKYIWPGKERGV